MYFTRHYSSFGISTENRTNDVSCCQSELGCCCMTGMFFASTMLMVSIALVMAVIVTNIYAKKNTSQRCPEWAVHLASRFFPSYSLPERESNASLVSLASGKDPELQQRQTPPSRPRSTNGKTVLGTVRRGTSPVSYTHLTLPTKRIV